MTNVCNFKSLSYVIPKSSSHWVGDGFHVRPLFGQLAFTNTISPFLMLDYASPKTFKPTSGKRGVGVHPHRGFETVTIALQGEIEHGDSTGNSGVIGPGDVQWMTAASGIVHEEYHSTKFSKEGGALEMVQLWVNLPSKDKMVPPRYQPILESDIPSVEMEDGKGSVRIIAGSYNGVKGPALTFSPMNIWQVLIKAHCHFQFEVEEGFNCMTFSRFGRFSHVDNNEKKTKVESEEMAIFNRDNGSWVKLEAGDEDVSLIVLSGQPLNEPIAARGPFVMNTETELRQAMYDYQTGKF